MLAFKKKMEMSKDAELFYDELASLVAKYQYLSADAEEICDILIKHMVVVTRGYVDPKECFDWHDWILTRFTECSELVKMGEIR